MDEIDKNIIRIMQEDFPLMETPYKQLAERLGMSETELLSRLRQLKDSGVLRKMGAVLRHRQVGFAANVLCAWQADEQRCQRAAALLTEETAVSHCYVRQTAADWSYNLYAMVHAHSHRECEDIVDRLSKKIGLTEPVLLYSIKEWKKTSMRYFRDS